MSDAPSDKFYSAYVQECDRATLLEIELGSVRRDLSEAIRLLRRLRDEGLRADEHGLELDGAWVAEQVAALLARYPEP